jgi:hypothetical protein
VSIWACAALRAAPSPKATLAIIDKLERLIGGDSAGRTLVDPVRRLGNPGSTCFRERGRGHGSLHCTQLEQAQVRGLPEASGGDLLGVQCTAA